MTGPWATVRTCFWGSVRRCSFLGVFLPFFLGVLFSSALAVQADPLSVTVSQVDLNRQTPALEVAVRVDPKQLEQALTAYFGESVDLTKASSLEAVEAEVLERRMARYLRDTFLLTAADDSPLTLRWVGWERESFRRLWMYAEIPLATDGVGSAPDGLFAGLTVSQRMFFELKTRQANTVRLRDGDWQTAVTCTREQPDRRVQPSGERPP